jgi:hypothetical protein
MATSPTSADPEKHDCNGQRYLSVLTSRSAQRWDIAESLDAGGANAVDYLLFELGVEPSMTVNEAASMLQWSYWKARRYFSQVEGICVSYRPKRYKRPYRTLTIPLSVFTREWQKMTGHEPEAADVIRHRLVVAIQK